MELGVSLDIRIRQDKVEIWHDGILMDQINEQEVANLVDLLTAFQNRPRKQYFLWKGNNGTIIGNLTHEEDLPSITIGGGGKREKFEPIGRPFVKDRFGNFKEY